MGLRGPGAKPVKVEKKTRRSKPSWKRAGLTRLQRIIRFIQSLPVTSGTLAGKKFKLRPWQLKIVEGIYREEGGRRVVRQALITMPRKNGKTGLTAALALCHLCGPEAVPRGQVYSAAAERKQAALLYEEMKAIIAAVPWLEDRIIVRDFTKQLEDVETGSVYFALSAEAKTKHGLNTSCWIYDELAQAKDRQLYDVLNTSTGARDEPLGIVISTQNPDPNHIMSELVDYGIQIRDGIVEDPSFLPVIYSAPESADPWAEETWFGCNPALGDFRSLREMRDFAGQAQRIPARESAFRLLYLNQRYVPGEFRFVPRADWDACGMKADEIKALPELLRGRACYGGLDLSGKNDLTAFCLLFPLEDQCVVLPFFWRPKEGLHDAGIRDRAPYELWESQEYLFTTPGRVLEYDYIAAKVAEVAAPYKLQQVACDPWQWEQFNLSLGHVGADHIELVKHGQSFKDMDGAVRHLEDSILRWELRHPCNPVLDWCIDNVRTAIDAQGNRKFDKHKSTSRIDGTVALAMAKNISMLAPPPSDYTYEVSIV